MIKKYKTIWQNITLIAALPFITGCSGAELFAAAIGSGAGAGSSVGSLFGGSSPIGGGGGGLLLAGGGGTIPGAGGGGGLIGAGAETIVSPEPASMLLLGSGMVAMTYFRNKKNKR